MANTKKRILCIEDEAEMIDLTRLVLEREGFEVLGAVGGMQGLEIIKREKPDLVLLDLMMPDIDGWEVYRQMKADPEMTGIPVIVVTARAQNIDKVLGLQVAKVDDYVTKPFGPKELLESIRKIFPKEN
ncbi:MAG: Alkaline phosphatase synthesis transcriptional regulatory protein PhoP [Anaerolineae bacterium]|nr:Alkaline phosphatase synthesis transcriptional regulatory protein PhoP [Anaerolineae bacterium]